MSNLSQPRLASQIALIINTSYFTKLARDLVLPSLPALTLYYTQQPELIEFNVSVYFIGILISRIFWPILAQTKKLKTLVLSMLGIFMLSSLLLISSTHGVLFLIARFFQAFSIASLPILTRFFVFKKSGDQKTLKLYSYLSLLSAWSPAVATGLGGFLQLHYGFMGNFYCLLVLGVLSFIIYMFTLSEPEEIPQTTRSGWSLYQEVLSSFTFWKFVFPFSALTATHALYTTVSPFILMKMNHLSADEYGMIQFILIAASVAGRTLCGRLIDFMSYEKLFKYSILLSLFGALFLTLLTLINEDPHLALVITPIFVSYLALGLITPSAKVFVMSHFSKASAIALNLLGMIEALVSGLGALMIILFPFSWFTLGACLCLMSLTSLLIMSKT